MAPSTAAWLHITVELHDFASLKENNATAPETDFDRPEQTSPSIFFGSIHQ